MKRYISSSKYTADSQVVLDDKIVIDIDVELPYDVVSSSTEEFSKFPGVEQFKDDVLKMLEQKFKFEVIEDMYQGKLQKGYISPKQDSISIYFDTYFDLSNAQQVLDEAGIRSTAAPEKGKVYCFIHLRFSDHDLKDAGYKEHLDFLDRNIKKYTEDRNDVTHVIDEESIDVPEQVMHNYYQRALLDLEYELGVRISMWVRKLNDYRRRGF